MASIRALGDLLTPAIQAEVAYDDAPFGVQYWVIRLVVSQVRPGTLTRVEIRGREIPVWVQAAVTIGAFTALLWAIEIVDAAMDNKLDQYGVQPRSDEGLLGILFAPVLHGPWSHLLCQHRAAPRLRVPALTLPGSDGGSL